MKKIQSTTLYCEKKYDLRWVFFYEHKTIRGVWTRPSKTISSSTQDLKGLLFAQIEGRNLETNKTEILHQVDAKDFVMFRWVACAGSSMGRNVPIIGAIHGLSIVTNNNILEVYIDGNSKSFPNNEKAVV